MTESHLESQEPRGEFDELDKPVERVEFVEADVDQRGETASDSVASSPAAESSDKSLDKDEESVGSIHRTGRMSLYARRFVRRPSAVVGLVLLLLLVLWAIFGGFLTHYNYVDLDFAALGVAPGGDHYFGTTDGGGDLYAMIVHGLGRSLMIAFLSSIVSTIIAAIYGVGIAYFEGAIEKIGMWILDMLLVVPSTLLIAILVRTAGGTSGWVWLTIGLTIFGWVGLARVLRTITMSIRERDYVRAAKFMGVNPFTVIVRHLIPNLGSVLVINTVLGVVSTVSAETTLSFLGLGIKAPDTSLGTILNEGQGTIVTQPWVLIAPATVLIILAFSVQLIGDGLRDAIDPYSRSGGKAA